MSKNFMQTKAARQQKSEQMKAYWKRRRAEDKRTAKQNGHANGNTRTAAPSTDAVTVQITINSIGQLRQLQAIAPDLRVVPA